MTSQATMGKKRPLSRRSLPRGRRRSSGFSLVELMVVIVIIGILTSMALGPLNNMRVLVFQTAVKTDLHGLDLLLSSYYANYRKFPTPPSGTNPAIGFCGSDGCYTNHLCIAQQNGSFACGNSASLWIGPTSTWSFTLGFQPDIRHTSFVADDMAPLKVSYILALPDNGSGWAAVGGKYLTLSGAGKCFSGTGDFSVIRNNANHSLCFVFNQLAPYTEFTNNQNLTSASGSTLGSCGMTASFGWTGGLSPDQAVTYECGNLWMNPVYFNPLTDTP